MSQPTERRRYPRVTLRCSAEWNCGAERLACYTGTLSMVGASVEFGEGEEIESGGNGTLRLRLPDPYGAFELKGAIVWTGNSNGRPIAGIEFSEYLAEAEKTLEKIIQRAIEEGRTP